MLKMGRALLTNEADMAELEKRYRAAILALGPAETQSG
jgi:hypothetical protein